MLLQHYKTCTCKCEVQGQCKANKFTYLRYLADAFFLLKCIDMSREYWGLNELKMFDYFSIQNYSLKISFT